MTIKVIGAGLARTGTMSPEMALEQLGYERCFHMVELLKNPVVPELVEGRGSPIWICPIKQEPQIGPLFLRGIRRPWITRLASIIRSCWHEILRQR